MTPSFSVALASIAVATSLAPSSAFVAPQLQSRPFHHAVARPMQRTQTIMGVATPMADGCNNGLPEIDDTNFLDLLNGEKAVLLDACAPVSRPTVPSHK